MEPRAAHRGAELEVRLERGDDLFERVEVMKMLVDQLSRGLLLRLAEGSSLLQPPFGSTDIERSDVELVDDERPARPDELTEPVARLVERIDVVE